MMNRKSLYQQLTQYSTNLPEQASCRQKILQFMDSNEDCFERSNLSGHITASAFILHPTDEKVLLMLHRKLNVWLQPGGHADGNADTLSVALREVREETGIDKVTVLSDTIFDLDIHRIPLFKSVPAHWHYDIRYLLRAEQDAFQKNDESLDLKWFSLSDIMAPASKFDKSLQRMAEKVCYVS